jgi:hypothetical protein
LPTKGVLRSNNNSLAPTVGCIKDSQQKTLGLGATLQTKAASKPTDEVLAGKEIIG